MGFTVLYSIVYHSIPVLNVITKVFSMTMNQNQFYIYTITHTSFCICYFVSFHSDELPKWPQVYIEVLSLDLSILYEYTHKFLYMLFCIFSFRRATPLATDLHRGVISGLVAAVQNRGVHLHHHTQHNGHVQPYPPLLATHREIRGLRITPLFHRRFA